MDVTSKTISKTSISSIVRWASQPKFAPFTEAQRALELLVPPAAPGLFGPAPIQLMLVPNRRETGAARGNHRGGWEDVLSVGKA